jgi:hypothetical protein
MKDEVYKPRKEEELKENIHREIRTSVADARNVYV